MSILIRERCLSVSVYMCVWVYVYVCGRWLEKSIASKSLQIGFQTDGKRFQCTWYSDFIIIIIRFFVIVYWEEKFSFFYIFQSLTAFLIPSQQQDKLLILTQYGKLYANFNKVYTAFVIFLRNYKTKSPFCIKCFY